MLHPPRLLKILNNECEISVFISLLTSVDSLEDSLVYVCFIYFRILWFWLTAKHPGSPIAHWSREAYYLDKDRSIHWIHCSIRPSPTEGCYILLSVNTDHFPCLSM